MSPLGSVFCVGLSIQAQEFLSKAANQDKAVEFKLSSGEDMVFEMMVQADILFLFS